MTALLAFLAKDLVGSILFFPLWWYGQGFKGLLLWIQSELSLRWRSYAIALWLKSILVPMYGQYDATGRIISVLMRIAVIIGRLVGFVAEVIVYLLFGVFWIVAPVLFLGLFLYSFTSGAFLAAVPRY